jgi:hypothetical protein
MKSPTQRRVDYMPQLASDPLILTNLKDRRVLFFWLLEIAGIIQFIFWLIVALKVAAVPVCFNPLVARFISEPTLSLSSRATISNYIECEKEPHVERSSQLISLDVWFGLGFTVVMDAFAVVLTFNRALIRKFHNVVSQRLIFLASMIFWTFWSWNEGKSDFPIRHPILCLAGGFILYGLLGSILDKLEKGNISPGGIARRGTFAQYSKDLGQFETSWLHATFLTVMVGGLGVFLTWLIPAPWSAGLPVIHILSEVCGLIANSIIFFLIPFSFRIVADPINERCKEDTSIHFSVLSCIFCRCLCPLGCYAIVEEPSSFDYNPLLSRPCSTESNFARLAFINCPAVSF